MKYIRNDKVVSGKLKDELVMMDIEAGRYFGLNAVATRIWDLLGSPVDIDELVSVLTEEYDISAAGCKEDVTDYLDEMLKLGLVKRMGS
jgi:CO dehydrogenase/acetyl-CoA synthase beta subunit